MFSAIMFAAKSAVASVSGSSGALKASEEKSASIVASVTIAGVLKASEEKYDCGLVDVSGVLWPLVRGFAM